MRRWFGLWSDAPPKPGQPLTRLRIVPDDCSTTYKNVHRGARALAEGLYAAIRNPGMHTPAHQALEQLAAFSILKVGGRRQSGVLGGRRNALIEGPLLQ